uniref:Immunoglobulin V-set domain-containing protein n=1 Tax=Electrophorus electricus TaxID=8005 RepID=A0A4W4EGN7_ELEEL
LQFRLMCCLSTGVAGANDVNQPDVLWSELGKSATINCSHTKGATYYQMYWYRQHQGETMKLIVFTSSYSKKPEFGNEFSESKFLANKTVPDRNSSYNDTLLTVYL